VVVAFVEQYNEALRNRGNRLVVLTAAGFATQKRVGKIFKDQLTGLRSNLRSELMRGMNSTTPEHVAYVLTGEFGF
jgi:hypothetical protein